MLTLVEPCNLGSLLDRPNLGCAMLIAACQEKGVKTTLVKGQTRFIKDMFLNDSEELWNLIKDLKENDLKKIGIKEYQRAVQEKGLEQFQGELKSLYQQVIIDKNPRNYFNGALAEKFNNLQAIFAGVYSYYLGRLNFGKLKIIDRYIAEITSSNPRYIGFSLESSFEPLSRIIRKRIKESTEIPVIAGGSLTPFINLKTADKIFSKEYFDYLVIGAGERALPSLIEALGSKKEPEGIANVFYRKKDRLRGNGLEVIRNLDDLPYPDYSQFDLDLYLTPERILPLQTARGCNWRKCAFCAHHSIDLVNYKAFSIKRIIGVMEHLQKKYSCSNFAFHDEGVSPRWSKRISEALLNSGLKDISINAYARPVDGYNNNNLLRLMRKAGFVLIHWGIESGSQRVLDSMNKGIKVSVASQILRKSSKNEIANFCFMLFGFPGETREEAVQTVEFLKNNADNIDELGMQLFGLDSNSPIGLDPKRWGVRIQENNSYSTQSGMSPEQANVFFSRLIAEYETNSIKISSDEFKYIFPGQTRRMLRFLSSSHKLLPNSISIRYLAQGKLGNVFPLILGEIKRRNSRTILYPVKISETLYINKNFPPREKILDGLEEKIFLLSDGRLSAACLISAVCRDFKHEYRAEYIRKKCADFLEEMFINNSALGFAKSWNTGRRRCFRGSSCR